MIRVHQIDESPESNAALTLEKIIIEHTPEIKNSLNQNIKIDIIPSVQCYGVSGGTQDVDLVCFLLDSRNEQSLFQSSIGTKIRSVCLTIEVKGHAAESIYFEGSKCFVKYQGKPHNVTDQSEKQKYSLKSYIEKNSRGKKSPWITNLIWLRNLPKSELPELASNIIGSDTTWQDILDKVAMLSGKEQSILGFNGTKVYNEALEALTFKIQPSKIDRKRMEAITKKVISQEAQYFTKIGQQLLVFRGRGGTGKTMRLLNIAYEMYENYGYRVLLLTYNRALVADLKRLLALLRIKNSIANRSISVNSIYSFIGKWLLALEVFKRHPDDYLDAYALYKAMAIEYLEGGAIHQKDINKAISEKSGELEWDLLLIDEAQDWPEDERDILYSIYGYKKIILADGVDQFVRSDKPIDWRVGEAGSNSQIVPLRKSLRLKQNICNVVQSFASKNELNWRLDPTPEAYGGEVIVYIGNSFSKKWNEAILEVNSNAGNENIDVLYCVPPNWIETNSKGERESRVASMLRDWGLECWDGVNEESRGDYPTKLTQLRIVQYDSCRGLEGWTVIACGFDEFYEYKKRTFREESEEKDLFYEEEEAAKEFAKRWLMIPLTRAIGTLVIHIKSEQSYIGKVFNELREEYPKSIKWIEEADDNR